MSDNYEDFDVIITPSVDQLKAIEELANHGYSLNKQIEELENLLKKLKEEFMKLTRVTLPDAMAAAGTSSFKTTSGVKITVKDFVNGSLPKDEAKREWAINWLIKNGGKDIIKSELVCEFEKGDGNLRKRNQAAEMLADMGVAFSEKEDVHWMTLASFAREKIENGEEIPLDKLGLFAGRKAKIEVE